MNFIILSKKFFSILLIVFFAFSPSFVYPSDIKILSSENCFDFDNDQKLSLGDIIHGLKILASLNSDNSTSGCYDEPEIMTTANGVDFVRTPNDCFKNLPDFPYESKHLDIDGLRQAYVDEGPSDSDPILLLHGQPSWSYLYRKMIPVLVNAGHRVIAMDHIGMGRSDKPVDIAYYSYLGHIDRLEKFIAALNLEHITLFAQDWGSLIGLHVAGVHPDWFDRIVIGDGTLPVFSAGIKPYPDVENPNEINSNLVSVVAQIPPQQPQFYDDNCNLILPMDANYFGSWIIYAMTAESFHAAQIIEGMTYFDLTSEEEAAYDAPFPSRIYMAGPRVFPSLVNDIPGVNDDAWAGLTSYKKPFLTIWAGNDPGNLGRCETQDHLINNIPGAEGQPHVRLPEASHFLQDDQGAEIARRIIEFIASTQESVRVGFEILEIQSPNSIRAWISSDISREEFDALQLPQGWIKNQPREGEPDSSLFYRSPDAVVDGEILRDSFFGFNWWHSATVTQANITLDEQGLLKGSTVKKFHEVTFNAGSTITVLLSPDDESYIRITRDANRVSDVPSIPDLWRLIEYKTSEKVVLRLPDNTTVIRTDNEDSFQGPVAELEIPDERPLELTPDLCDDPTKMALLMKSLGNGNISTLGEVNLEQVQRMVTAPTEGPFYMVNLIRFREKAQYPDGRETDLTGREANALYSPIEFLEAIGARVVFSTDVDNQIDGDNNTWESVAIVEYPCPLAFFAMSAAPDFQARAIHKQAGVEKTIVLVTELMETPIPADPDQSESPYPPTTEDPAFDLIHVMNFHDQAQYEAGSDEPVRTGQEAWQLYQAAGSEASSRLGIYLTARFVVQGVFIGDDRPWDEIVLVHMPSREGFQALLNDSTRQAGRYHRYAALADNYSMITYPTISEIPGSPSSENSQLLPVTIDGTGTLCKTDKDCPGNGVNKCLTNGGEFGFCTREGCNAGDCQAPYVFCYNCNAFVASMLPFDGSACLLNDKVDQLTSAPASCTCD
jgi:haloalkane dehalogenase